MSKDAIDRLAVIEQGVVSDNARAAELGRVSQAIHRLHKVMGAEGIENADRNEMSAKVAEIEAELERIGGSAAIDPLEIVSENKRDTYRQVFGLIYECSANRAAAKSLIDKIIQRLEA